MRKNFKFSVTNDKPVLGSTLGHIHLTTHMCALEPIDFNGDLDVFSKRPHKKLHTFYGSAKPVLATGN
jgi:hypothetical protein